MSHCESSPGIIVRTVFLSDIHLGTRECQAERLLSFLRSLQAETVYLVGDIVDLWSLRNGLYWPATHAAVLRELVTLARRGTRVIYVPGNHDELCRDFCGQVLAGIRVEREYLHELRDGRRLLVLHGDEFDGAVKSSRIGAAIGSWLYDLLLRWGYRLNLIRRLLGLGHWSLVTWLKGRVGNVRRHVERFEQAAAAEARRRGLDGVICGHIHRPTLTSYGGTLYCNDGDWVEHCSALIEDSSGNLRLLDGWEMPATAPAELEELLRAA